MYGRHGEVMSPTQSKGAGAAGTGRTRRVKFEDTTRFRDSLEVQTLEGNNPPPSGEAPSHYGAPPSGEAPSHYGAPPSGFQECALSPVLSAP